MTTATLTPLETTVLAALKQNAEDCSGGDFAIMEEVAVKGLSRKALGGVVTNLITKNLVSVHVTYVNGSYNSKGTKVTQVIFYDGEGNRT